MSPVFQRRCCLPWRKMCCTEQAIEAKQVHLSFEHWVTSFVSNFSFSFLWESLKGEELKNFCADEDTEAPRLLKTVSFRICQSRHFHSPGTGCLLEKLPDFILCTFISYLSFSLKTFWQVYINALLASVSHSSKLICSNKGILEPQTCLWCVNWGIIVGLSPYLWSDAVSRLIKQNELEGDSYLGFTGELLVHRKKILVHFAMPEVICIVNLW